MRTATLATCSLVALLTSAIGFPSCVLAAQLETIEVYAYAGPEPPGLSGYLDRWPNRLIDDPGDESGGGNAFRPNPGDHHDVPDAS